MRRPLALALLPVALAAAPARATGVAEIVLTLRYDTTCASATACETTLTGIGCLERALGAPCTVDPVTFSVPALPNNVCFLAARLLGPAYLVVHTVSAGDVRVQIATFATHGAVATLTGVAVGLPIGALVMAGYAGGTVTDMATRPCPDATDGRLVGALVLVQP